MSKQTIVVRGGGLYPNVDGLLIRNSISGLKLNQSVGLAPDLSGGQIYSSWQCRRAYQVSEHHLLLPDWVCTSIKLSTTINVICLDLSYHVLREIRPVWVLW